MARITFKTWLAGVAADVSSVVLEDPTGVYGIKETVSGTVVVVAGTAMAASSTGVYTYSYSEGSSLTRYTAYIKCTEASRKVTYHEVEWQSPAVAADGTILPSLILATYLRDTLALFSNPSESTTWPLYIRNLPDGTRIEDNLASIFDTAGVYDGKMMDGTEYEHYGIQIRIRCTVYSSGWEKASVLVNTLKDVTGVNVTVSSRTFRIQNISRTSAIVHISTDEKQRDHFTVNFLVSLREL